MTKHEIIQLFINNLPAIIAVFGVIFSVLKVLFTLKSISSNIDQKTDYTQLNDDLRMSIQENYELKKQIAENLKQNSQLKEQLELIMLELSEKKEMEKIKAVNEETLSEMKEVEDDSTRQESEA